ncbi:MAG: histidine ammonia-lyase [Candidatus Magasanikbacteria bacterium]
MTKVYLDPDKKLDTQKVKSVATNSDIEVSLTERAEENIKKCREVVENLSKDKAVYGINTGFGSFKDKEIDYDDVIQLQKNLIRSHSAGVGSHFSRPIVKAMLVLRLYSFTFGYSGVRLKLAQLVKDMINKEVIPVVPSQGSVGASGDLAPLSHAGLVLMGEGRAYVNDSEILDGADALKKYGLRPIEFKEKEGLAWNNSTSAMSAVAALVVNKSKRLMQLADLACAISYEAFCGITDALDSDLHELKPHSGQKKSAENIKQKLEGSKLVDSYPERIQDSYSLRCAPQVHGAAREAINHVEQVVNTELNSVTDNPLVFPEKRKVISGGNFHGEAIAIAVDSLANAISELANISERRTAKLVDEDNNHGLPAFLVPEQESGVNSGYMIPQYTAAALVSENKSLSHPASVDSIPTSANQEDHVSMGTIGARQALEVVENTENVIAIELLAAAQGVEFRGTEEMGQGTKEAYKKIRNKIDFTQKDREFHKDIEKIKQIDFFNNEYSTED